MESATSSRETRLMRMPLWFIDKPSDTDTVVKGTGMPWPAATPSRAASACGPKDMEQGVFSPCWLTMPIMGLPKSASSTPTARKKARCGVRSRPSMSWAEFKRVGGVNGGRWVMGQASVVDGVHGCSQHVGQAALVALPVAGHAQLGSLIKSHVLGPTAKLIVQG